MFYYYEAIANSIRRAFVDFRDGFAPNFNMRLKTYDEGRTITIQLNAQLDGLKAGCEDTYHTETLRSGMPFSVIEDQLFRSMSEVTRLILKERLERNMDFRIEPCETHGERYTSYRR